MKLTRIVGAASGVGVAALAALLLLQTLGTDAGAAPAVSATATPNPTSEAAATDYDRELFGPRWADVDRNGCDTRNDTLARDLTDVTYKPDTNGCVVLTGTLHDPYTGETVAFTRVSEGYQPVQIDHIIPLAVAWASGADSWTDEQRTRFANDPANLQTTTANQTKGDSTPSAWMPPGELAACEYSTRYLEVATDYALDISAADRDALTTALISCTSAP